MPQHWQRQWNQFHAFLFFTRAYTLTRVLIFSTMPAYGVQITREFPAEYQLCYKSALRPVTRICLSFLMEVFVLSQLLFMMCRFRITNLILLLTMRTLLSFLTKSVYIWHTNCLWYAIDM